MTYHFSLLTDSILDLAPSMKVSNSGIRINQDKPPFIFDKYVRDDAVDSNKYPGTGLGLYFVKKYVENLGGANCLWLVS